MKIEKVRLGKGIAIICYANGTEKQINYNGSDNSELLKLLAFGKK